MSRAADAIRDAAAELGDYEQQTWDDGFGLSLAGGTVEVITPEGLGVAITSRDTTGEPVNVTHFTVWNTVAAASAITAVVRSDAAYLNLEYTIQKHATQ